MKRKLSQFLFAVIFILSGLAATAQPGGPPCASPPCGGPGTNPGPPGAVPLSGIELIIAAGAVFGANRVYRKNRKT